MATPLLYETVVLRSMAQSQSLGKALKKNPAFAVYLKKLRVEGAFGALLGKVVSAATWIADLCLSLTLLHKDNVGSLCHALAQSSSRRLVLVGYHTHNRQSQSLVNTLVEVPASWAPLVSLSHALVLCFLISWAVRCDDTKEILPYVPWKDEDVASYRWKLSFADDHTM